MGAHLAQLRRQFNLTQQEVSERLHIRTRYVSAIEEGRFDLIPGQVYARGYVQNYAEFLGLNPAEVVAQCFTGSVNVPQATLASHTTNHTIIPRHQIHNAANWRALVVLAIIGLTVVLIFAQLTTKNNEISATESTRESTVEPVPESILKSMRNLVMTTPINHTCLTKSTMLNCFFSGATTRKLIALESSVPMYFGGAEAAEELEALSNKATPPGETHTTPAAESLAPPSAEND